MSTVWCERHDRAVPEDRDRCHDCETELILKRAIGLPLPSAVADALAGTAPAGWRLPLSTASCTQPGYMDCWDLNEADGTRIAIIGAAQDARLICVLLNEFLTPASTVE